MVRESGVNLFYESIANRSRCCGVRKVEPFVRAPRGLDGWITGLHHDQAPTRAAVRKFETYAESGGLVKVNPLAGHLGRCPCRASSSTPFFQTRTDRLVQAR
jgi:phosphoadenosine phosphosulfate reductase